MTPEIGFRLMAMEAEFNAALDKIHGEALRKFRALARATGQRTRVDRKGLESKGMARQGGARQGTARQGRARPGEARRGGAGQGAAGQGKGCFRNTRVSQ